MFLETLNQSFFGALNASGSGPGTVAALEALAEAPIWILPALVGVAWLIGRRADRRAAVTAALAGCVSMTLAHLASLLIDHPRPFMLGLAPNLLGHAPDSSFPSDHTTLFFALAVAFIRRPLARLPGLGAFLAILGLGVGFARVSLGVHFPLDILGGAVIGSLAALATDIGLRRVIELLFAAGEYLRGFVRPLARHDGREACEGADARPAR